MRTSYRTLLNIVKRNFTFDDIRNSPTQGKVIVFCEGTEHIRIVLVEGNSHEQEIGIHLRSFTNRDELETTLVDACNTALRDNFPTIWVHQKPKPSEDKRLRRVKCAQNWINGRSEQQMLDQAVFSSGLRKAFINDPEAVLESMNEEQISLVCTLLAASYSGGCAMTRKFFVRMKEHEKPEEKGA